MTSSASVSGRVVHGDMAGHGLGARAGVLIDTGADQHGMSQHDTHRIAYATLVAQEGRAGHQVSDTPQY
jgi:hypothetical protein